MNRTEPIGTPPRPEPAQIECASATVVSELDGSEAAGIYFCTVKPAFDRALAAILLLAGAPLFATSMLSIWATSGRPLFYRPRLVGRNGREFRALKFRTMVPGADQELERLLNERHYKKSHSERGKLPNDPRTTRLGRFLRRSSLDELPQLLNVLLGEMSLVGPRPLPRRELEQRYGSRADSFLKVKPGLTGLWQVSGRSLLTYARRIELDLYYAGHVTLGLDLWILMRTPFAVLSGRGAW